MTIAELIPFKDQHGQIKYVDKNGEPGEWFGYIRVINCNHIVFEDNETPHKFKISEVKSFTPIKLQE